MKILFIGGTKFVGRTIVEDAIREGHDVDILQRGSTNKDLFPFAKKFFGDRLSIDELLPSDVKYDVVVDTCGYHPEVVKKSCVFLKSRTDLYVFISTCSVYSDFSVIGLNEKSTVGDIETVPPFTSPITNENYGPLKALCENEVKNHFTTSNYLILRPCIIVGPYDHTNRFDRLISSICQDKIEIPNDLDATLQFVDVRAISKFVLEAKENKVVRGTYNVVGPSKQIRYFDFIEIAKSILNPKLQIDLKDPEANDFPMYLHGKEFAGFFKFDGSKAYENGFPVIPIEDTVRATAKYLKLI